MGFLVSLITHLVFSFDIIENLFCCIFVSSGKEFVFFCLQRGNWITRDSFELVSIADDFIEILIIFDFVHDNESVRFVSSSDDDIIVFFKLLCCKVKA